MTQQLRTIIRTLLGSELDELTFASPEREDILFVAGRTIEQLRFSSSAGDEVPAVLARADLCERGPAILYCHAHGDRYDIGMSELLDGRPALTSPYLDDLLRTGHTVLCLEMPCFGARATPDESSASKAHLWHGRTLFGRMLAEQAAGLSYLAQHPAVDPTRIATLGISMGGTLAWWLAAMDTRVAAVVSLCCFADMGELIHSGTHDGHGIYMTVPGLLPIARTGKVAGLTAPRPQFFGIGLQDWSTPEPAFKIAQTDIENAYSDVSAEANLAFHIEAKFGHKETPAMRAAVLEFLSRHL